MAFCLTELHLWSTRSSLNIADTDIGTYQYYEKGEPVSPRKQHYLSEKQQFAEGRGYSWTPRNQRPEKLRDSLKELEELLETSPCVHWRWKNKRCSQLLLSSGLLVTLSLTGPQLLWVSIDRALVGRLPGDTISDGLITDQFVLVTFTEKSQVCLVHLNRHVQGSPETGRRAEKLSPSELKVYCVDLPGAVARRVARRLALSSLQDVAVCWWPAVCEELWPWCPVPSECDRANLVLLACGGVPSGLKVLSCIRTEGDPLDCRFSLLQPYQVLTVELMGQDGAVHHCVYECARGRPQRLQAETIPASARPVCWCRDPAEGLLLLGLCDSSLVLYDTRRGTCCTTRTPMLPSLAAWHPAGALVVVGSGQGELQCFDAGLTLMGIQLLSEDLGPTGSSLCLSRHLRASGGLVGLTWAAPVLSTGQRTESPEVHDLLALSFYGGPLGVLRFRLGALTGGQLGPAEVAQQRVHCGQVGAAVALLGTMDWSTMGTDCYRVLTTITEQLLRQELNTDTEAQLEATLGTFYAPSRPLSDTVVLEFRDAICKYARRFFHHLLRYQRFEKAFLLAVDISARDLFMDIHYIAQDKGELVLADVAKRNAYDIDAELATRGPDDDRSPQGGRNPECDTAVTGRGTHQRGDKQADKRQPSLRNEVKGHSPAFTCSQASAALCSTAGTLDREQPGVRPGMAKEQLTWPWPLAEINLADDEDQVTAELDSLKVVHFGLV